MKDNIKRFAIGLGIDPNNISDFGIQASFIDINSLPIHIKPDQVRDEIPTLNKHGYMKSEFEFFTKSFVDIAAVADTFVLEVGPAYGWITHKVLEEGATITALDVSKEHLEVLLREAPVEHLERLYVYNAAFPDEVDFPKNSFSAILMSRILHFLDGDTIERGLEKVHEWLTPNGRFIATNCSIYHSSIKSEKDYIIEDKIASGEKWPGIIAKIDSDPIHDDYSQDFLNVFYKEQLEKLLPRHGFKIEKIEYFDYPSDPWPDQGKGHIGFIASKL